MKILFKTVVVILALFLELVFLALAFGYGHGQIVDTVYRRQERLAALIDYHQHPSPETKARFQDELRLMHKHEDWKAYLAVGSFLVINGVWIYFYFRGRRRPNTALEPTPTAP